MSEITVYGASDDLIEVVGAIQEEFGAWSSDDETSALAFSDGTVLSVRYDDQGFWRVNRIATGSASYEHREATDERTDYSDRVTLRGDLRWVLLGKAEHFVRAKQEAST